MLKCFDPASIYYIQGNMPSINTKWRVLFLSSGTLATSVREQREYGGIVSARQQYLEVGGTGGKCYQDSKDPKGVWRVLEMMAPKGQDLAGW